MLTHTNSSRTNRTNIDRIIAHLLYLDGSILQGIENSAFQISDIMGNVCFEITLDGRTLTNSLTQSSGVPDITFLDNIQSDFNHIFVYGQSLGAASFSGETVSKTQKFNNLFRFISGVRTYDCNYLITSNRRIYMERLGVPEYKEMINYASKFSARETPVMQYKYSAISPLTERRAFYNPKSDGSSAFVKDGETPENDAALMHHQDGETPATGCLEAIDFLIEMENSVRIEEYTDLNFLASCPAYGSASFKNLWPIDKGGTIQSNLPDSTAGDGSNLNHFEVLLSDVYFAKHFFDNIGKTYNVTALLFYHESTDYLNTGIKFAMRRVLQLFSLINDRVKDITGQQNDILFVLHQSSLNSPQGQMELACGIETMPTAYDNTVVVPALGNKTEHQYMQNMPDPDVPEYGKSNVILGQPIYGFEYASDFIHLSSKGSKAHGLAMGTAIKHGIINGSAEKWKPIHPISHTYRQINIGGAIYYELRLKFHLEYPPLILDQAAIHGTQANPNAISRGDKMGFIFSKPDGSLIGFNGDNSDFITSIEVIRGDTLKILTKTDVSGYSLHYAYDYISHPNSSKQLPWGNLRDKRGDTLKMPIDDSSEVRVDNWCVSFKYNF